MKKTIIFLALALILTSACNSQNTEEAIQGYLSEKLNDFKDRLPEELKMVDSLLSDTEAIKRKIAETTDLDSLKKYNDLLMDAKNLLKKNISTIDSISPEIKQLLRLNQ